MARYDFNQLEPQSFTELCNALLHRLISERVTPGPLLGPDAGIDACYEGPGKGDWADWHGAWIFQYKFHNVARQGVDKCRQAVRRDVENELEKVFHKYHHRTDNYILITNVPCAATPGSAARQWLDGVAARYAADGLRRVDLWDLDKLTSLLDVHRDLADHYFGGGLSVHDYLAAVDEYCRQLPYLSLHTLIGGADSEAPPSLGETYVRLQAQPRSEERRPPDGSEAEKGEPDERDLRPERPVFVEQALSEHARLVILGEAGAGKSTLLRHLAQCAWQNPASIGLDAPHLSVLVPLRRSAAADGALPARLSQALCAELPLVQDLPADFFTAWPSQTGARWLLLLDGLDEVPAQERRAVANLIEGWARQVKGHRVVVTSRTAGYEALDARAFRHYTLLPFDPKQVSVFARNWFGDDAATFQAELDRVRVGALAGTPLLLTVAAAVYWRWHKLPPRRSGLYGQFVDILLVEDERRPEVRAALSDLLAYRRPILERIALWCQEELGGGLMPERDFGAQVARILQDEKGLRPFEVEAQAKRYVRAVRERGGLLVRRGDALDFIHPTFREYLAACALRRQPRAEVDEIIRTRWLDDAWREVVLFLFCLRSDEGTNVSGLVQEILESGEQGLYFAAACLAEQMIVDEELSNRVVDDLLRAARGWSPLHWFFDSFLGSPMAALVELRGNERAVASFLTLARDEGVDAWVRKEAAVELGRLGRAEEAAQAWLALARDQKVSAKVRKEAAAALGELGRADDLLALARDEKVWARVRREAAVALGELGLAEETAQAWLALAFDEGVEAEVREDAAVALGKLGRAEETVPILLALARDGKVKTGVRRKAAVALGELGRVEEAVQAWLAMARDEKAPVKVRREAALALGKLRQTEEAAQAWLALARDEKVKTGVRREAAVALGKLGRAEEAAQAWLALACDEKVKAGVRKSAAVALGRLGRASPEVLSGLRSLAADPRTPKIVRRAVRDSLERLERSSHDPPHHPSH
jgi:tetratricopeptide (TPR) repeat protein/energy-coupling factor transporter ATP-binding protein EcfA2